MPSPETDPPTPAATAAPPAPSADEMKEILAKLASFAQLAPQPVATPPASIEFLRDVPVTITARLGHVVMPIADVLKLGPGSVVELEEGVDHNLELLVRGMPFAKGEVVVVNEHFGIRIKALMPPRSPRTDA